MILLDHSLRELCLKWDNSLSSPVAEFSFCCQNSWQEFCFQAVKCVHMSNGVSLCRYLDDVALHHLIDAMCKLSSEAMDLAYSNQVGGLSNSKFCDITSNTVTSEQILWHQSKYCDITANTVTSLQVLWHHSKLWDITANVVTSQQILWHQSKYCDIIASYVTCNNKLWHYSKHQ